MECLMKSSRFKDIMNKTWKPKSTEKNRGFREYKVGEKTITAEEQSCQVEDMLEIMASYTPYTTVSAVILEAQSFNWIYNFLPVQYGHKRSDEALTVKFAQITPNDNLQDEEEPTQQGREGTPHHRLTRPTGISTIRGAASAWSSFLDACRH